MKAPEADHTFYLCRQLAKAGHDIRVITGKNAVIDEPDVQVLPIMPTWGWRNLPRLVRHMKQWTPDAVLLFYIGWIYDHHPMITFAPTFSKALRNLSTTMGHSTGLIREQCPVW